MEKSESTPQNTSTSATPQMKKPTASGYSSKPSRPDKIPQILDYLRVVQGQCRGSSAAYNSRKSSKLLRSLVTHPSYTYKQIFHDQSKRPLYYEQNMVYGSDFTSMLAVGCHNFRRNKFLSAPFRVKIDSYLYVKAPYDRTCKYCSRFHCCQPSLLALSLKNELYSATVIHYDARTGYVNRYILYPYTGAPNPVLDWNVPYHTVSVIHRQDRTTLKIYLFSVYPITFNGSFSLNRKMTPTRYMKDASLANDMLVVHENVKTVTLYSFQDKIEDLRSAESNTISIDDLPPPLLSVGNCDNFDMQIGGFPFRLLVRGRSGGYFIKLLEDDNKNENTVQNIRKRKIQPRENSDNTIAVIRPTEENSIEEDSVYFDECESGHIIQQGPNSVRMFKITEGDSCTNQLEPIYPPVLFHSSSSWSRPVTSRYGRPLSRSNRSDDDPYPTVVSELDLEDELDIYFMLSCYQEGSADYHLNILDTATLSVLKSAPLPIEMHCLRFPFSTDYQTNISVAGDLDLLIVNYKYSFGHGIVIYQLSRGISA